MSTKQKFIIFDLALMLFLVGVVITTTMWGGETNATVPAPGSTLTIPRLEKPIKAKIEKPTDAEIEVIIESELQDPVVEVDQYIQYFMGNSPPWRYKNAREFIPYVVAHAEQQEIDHLLLAVTISLESSWLPNVIGEMGEKGLTQVHGVAARGYNLADAEQQIAAGASWLAKCIRECDGSILGGLSKYQAGTSCRPHKASRKRIKKYKEARQEIRGY